MKRKNLSTAVQSAKNHRNGSYVARGPNPLSLWDAGGISRAQQLGELAARAAKRLLLPLDSIFPPVKEENGALDDL